MVASENEFGFTFAGVHSREFNIKIIDIKRTIVPALTRNSQDIPAKKGDVLLGTSVGNRTFDVDIEIQADSHIERNALTHDIANWLMPIDNAEFDLIFDDDSAYTYYATVTNADDIERSLYKGRATITFVCSDPLGYGEYISEDFTSNPFEITPGGDAECYPIFTCIPKTEVTKIAITDEDGNYIYIGGDVDPDTGETPVDKEPLVLHDQCNSLADWEVITSSNLTFQLENGTIGGSMRTTGETIKIGTTSDGYADFGSPTNNSKWHGAVVRRMLTDSLEDYKIRVRLYNKQYYARARGKVEVYLLDRDGVRIGKIMLKDNGNSEQVYAQLQIGSSTVYKNVYYGEGKINKGKTITKSVKLGDGVKKTVSKGKTTTVQQWKTMKLSEDTSTDTFTDFYGYLELTKIGNKYTAKIMKLDDNHNPVWDKPLTYYYTDTENKFNNALAGIAIYCAKMDITEDAANPIKHYTNNGMGVTDIKIYEIIDGGNSGDGTLPTIAYPGDEIKLNCENGKVYKNGDLFMKELYIGSNFPIMQGGIPKEFSFEPDLDQSDWYYELRPTTN